MKRFFIKKPHNDNVTFLDIIDNNTTNEVKEENNVIKNVKEMTTKDKIQMVASVINEQPKVRRMKKDKGLIERTESSITVLTEDNKELLKD